MNTSRFCECGELKDRDMIMCDNCRRIEAMLAWRKFKKTKKISAFKDSGVKL